ncbi:MAG: ABC transporter permease, partial [Rhizobacter sp.]|nr:ABC transporter permease [Chlorobiales bacterium]
MFKNYFKVAWRNLVREKGFAAISIAGLAIGIAAQLIIFLNVRDELTFDGFHANKENIYRLYRLTKEPKGITRAANMPVPIQPALEAEFGEAVRSVRVDDGDEYSVKSGEKKFSEEVAFVDPAFFEMFTFPLVRGDAKNVLQNLNSIVITEDVAAKFFGDAEAMGKTLTVNIDRTDKQFIVTGIVKTPPNNSSIRFAVVVRYEQGRDYEDYIKYWTWFIDSNVYLELPAAAAPTDFERRLIPFAGKYFANVLSELKSGGAKPDATGEVFQLRLQPFKEIHFTPEIRSNKPFVDPVQFYALLGIGIFILLIACINFINLSIGRSAARAKEVGVRKVLGADKGQLFMQFWSEAVLICLIALVIGIALVELVLPVFNALIEKKLSMAYSPATAAGLAGFALLIGLLAGSYPALVLTRLQPAAVLKGSGYAAMSKGNNPNQLRNVLVVVQFSLSVLLIALTLAVFRQLEFMRTADVGFKREQVIAISLGSEVNAKQAVQQFRDRLAGVPAVQQVTATMMSFGTMNNAPGIDSESRFDYQGRAVNTALNRVDFEYVEMLSLPLLAGRGFSRAFATDSSEAAIINEAMLKEMGETDANAVIGKKIGINSDKPWTVVGVVKDYHFNSLKEKIQPMTLVIDGANWLPLLYVWVKVSPENLPQTMSVLEATWKGIAPASPFVAGFLDENIERQYQSEQRQGMLVLGASVLAVLLSCLGLFALASLSVAKRTKEIGIRKILGATAMDVVMLVSRDFVWLVVIANIVALPAAYLLMQKWLEGFAYKAEASAAVFIFTALLAFAIAALSVGSQAVKAAVQNPVKS